MAEVLVLGQPAASVCSKQQACAVNFSRTTKYYKIQELILAVRFLRGALNLEQSCWPLSPAPLLPSQRQQRVAQTGWGKRNFPVSRAWLIGTDCRLLVPEHQEPDHRRDQKRPPTNNTTVIKCSKRNISIGQVFQTSWSFPFNMQQFFLV